MTTVGYLSRPEALRREIVRKQQRAEMMRRLAARLTSPLREVTVCSSPDPARMQAFLAEAADLEQEILLMEEDLRRVLAETLRFISSLADELLIRLLELRYLDALPWTEIAGCLGYSRASVFRLHRAALDLLPPPPEDPEDVTC